jgi:hypothetical protein
VGLAWIVVLAFLRITTRGSVIRKPLPPQQALEFVGSWLAQPHVTAVGPGANHWSILRSLLVSTGMAGILTSDCHLAALALERGCPVYSADNDFKRFPGIEHVNPLVP